jgi:hypothetical protein
MPFTYNITQHVLSPYFNSFIISVQLNIIIQKYHTKRQYKIVKIGMMTIIYKIIIKKNVLDKSLQLFQCYTAKNNQFHKCS